MTGNQIDAVESYFTDLQQTICAALQGVEQQQSGAEFKLDNWQYASGGGGSSRVLADGKVFERAGVNFSKVSGTALPDAATRKRPELVGAAFTALGVSLVVHPRNPHVPTTHMNVRYFNAQKPRDTSTAVENESVWWFGGGFDLTPYYPVMEDVVHWHTTANDALRPFDPLLYDKYKAWCDEYFYLPHRDETRGVGGLFFDDLNENEHGGFEGCFSIVRSVGDHFVPAYLPIVQRRYQQPYGEQQREFQLYRRGRYVEFNLLYDRGTLFGLQSKGRTESILMSMPPLASWRYDYQPEPDSPEAVLYTDYLKPRDWLARLPGVAEQKAPQNSNKGTT